MYKYFLSNQLRKFVNIKIACFKKFEPKKIAIFGLDENFLAKFFKKLESFLCFNNFISK